jgi:amino acid transporter
MPLGVSVSSSFPPDAPDGLEVIDHDERRLNEMGYQQELKRGMGSFSNFAVSFTIISIITGVLQTFWLGMIAGGPRTMIIDWVVAGTFITFMGLSLAEICSAYPTAGGLYYWSARLARRRAPVWSWYTGWFNLLGQVAVTASIDFGLANFIGFFIKLAIAPSFAAKPWQILLIYGIVLATHGTLNTFGVKLVAKFNDISVWWHLVGTAVIVVVLFALPNKHQTLGSVFSSYTNSTGLNWFHGSGLWISIVGLGVCAYTITGFDASAHMSEETRDAATSGPRGIVMSIVVSAVAGLILLISLCYALPGSPSSDAYNALPASGAAASANLFLDVLSRHLAEFLIIIGIVAQFFCGMASVTANSRMVYAFSRDGAVPGHKYWHRINPRTRTPTNSIWFSVAFSFILGVPSLKTSASGVPVAFNAVVSVAVVAFTISFALPILLRLLRGSDFTEGPVTMGRWSKPLNVLSLIWTVVICAAFLLPQGTLHVDGKFQWSLFNYAPIAVAVVVGYATLSWFLSARHWFTGPKWTVEGTPLDVEADVPPLGHKHDATVTGAQA